VAGIYVDTSALGRVLLAEPDAHAILAELSNYEELWSSSLLTVELGRLGKVRSMESEAAEQLRTVFLHPVTEDRLRAAATVDPPTVRSLDAIHLVSAIELRAAGSISAAMTFDRQLDAGLAHHGIRVIAPIV
jgi:uncharacterized protein